MNRTHRLEVPDSGTLFGDDDENGNEPPNLTGPRALGASLVVVYRDPTKPYKGIVIHDGAFTKRAFQAMNQTINGWYQASTGAPKSASLTQIVGDGRLLLSEQVRLNGQLIATNPFRSLNGPKWDNWRTSITLPNGASSASVRIEPHTVLSDCTHHSAWIMDTTVQDTDADGLLDIWETNNNGLGLSDPTGLPLPDISSMADPNHKDVFFEVAYMHAKEGTTYGGVPKPQHSHLMKLEAINLAGDALKKAPVGNPDGTTGIDLHVDVGANYQLTPPNPYIVPAALARGGKNMSETAACPNPADPINGQPVECVLPDGSQGPIPGQYPAHPGTVGYMTGVRFVQELLGFDRNRKDIYRYALFAHFLGLPVESCQLPDGPDPDNEPDNDTDCQTNPANPKNAKFHVPRTNSGIAEYPGKILMATLGGFDDEDGKPIGSVFMQAGTFFHEFGHTVELTHAGPRQNPRLENCLPFYFSSMNYLYQLRGRLDANAQRTLGFAESTIPGLDENDLSDGSPYALLPFRLGFYAPWSSSYASFLGNPATKHCDGSDLSQAEKDAIALGGGMARFDHIGLEGPIVDWDADSDLEFGGIPPQDLNFNGAVGNLGQGLSDWPFVATRLNQLGAGRNVGGLYIDALGRRNMGPFSLDVGRGDIGRGDIGRGDIGRGDIGRGDIGRGDIGRGDIGRGDIGRGDIGRGDIGRGDIGAGDTDVGGTADEPFGEIDLPTAKAAAGDAPTPPSGLIACLTTEGDTEPFVCSTDGGLPVRLDWEAPTFGAAIRYFVYRFPVVDPEAPFPPSELPTEEIAIVVRPVEGSLPTTYIDVDAAPNTDYAYFVIAEFPDDEDDDENPEFSPISNFARITTPEEQQAPPNFVDFEQFPDNPSLFQGTTAPVTVGIVTVSGGMLLNQTVALPANQTVVYGTTDFAGCGACASSIAINFAQPVGNVRLSVYNGQTFSVTYTIQDDQDGTQTITLVSNSEGGAATVTLPGEGITQVVVRPLGEPATWDFFVDNIGFTPM